MAWDPLLSPQGNIVVVNETKPGPLSGLAAGCRNDGSICDGSSQGAGKPRSARRAACANASASGSLATAAATISRSAFRCSGMCCRAAPQRQATCRQNSRSWRRPSSAYLKATGSHSVALATSSRSTRSSGEAPCSTEPRPMCAAWSTKSRSARHASAASAKEAPCTLMASNTKSRSLCNSGAAYLRAAPEKATACSTSCLSPLSSSVAKSSAIPKLARMAASMSSRSLRTSSGALVSTFQSVRTAARQAASRQLLVCACVVEDAPKTPCLSAAKRTPFIITVHCARPAPSSSRCPAASKPHCRFSISSGSASSS
mmetsp:Transcript_88207/g.285523  ORF Transcript_88207/g.285523 Transcript_88207/m.285523 type:complete len:315 (+) Transcript_88207:887-1831(+)